MARIRACLVLVLSMGSLVQCASSSQSANERLYLLEAASGGQQWCIYRNEIEWDKDVQRQHAMVVATVEYVSGRLVAVHVTEQAETGDWIVYDNYTVGSDGQPQSLHRTVNTLPGERREERVFKIHRGRATERSRATRGLDTDTPLLGGETWLPDVPVVTNIQAFPFAALIAPEHLKILPSKRCVAVER